MIIYNFSRIFKARGIDKPFSYLVKTGFSSNAASRIANSNISTFNLTFVEKLCKLFQCTPNDLLEWVPTDQDVDNETNPLYPLRRTNKVHQLTQLLNSVPLNRLIDIENIIKKEIEPKE
jgi:DNA-binding Xre family transcriptional regulator